MLNAGEGRIDISPPLGIELAGFHKPAGQERVVTGIRQRPEARALALEVGDTRAILLSLEICSISAAFARDVQARIQQATGIPAAQVRVCATHTHSMPAFSFFRQWGAISPEFMASTATACVEAAKLAIVDLAPADCYYGSAPVENGNFNRTAPEWKTDLEWSAGASDATRWLDTLVQALYLLRADGKKSLLWYHFCAHPVCFTDGEAGPDWPGMVAEGIASMGDVNPSFLQGHIGDVNPGDGTPWIGDADETVQAVGPALYHAMNHSELVKVDELRIVTGEAAVPFDLERLREELRQYRENPEACSSGAWVDAGFAKAWYESASQAAFARDSYAAPISAMRLGEIAFLFHPSELYSYYGLKLRFDSPFPHTFLVGYCDDFIGYLTDPMAYQQNEYAALVVPKICDLPPFTTEAARTFTQQCHDLIRRLA